MKRDGAKTSSIRNQTWSSLTQIYRLVFHLLSQRKKLLINLLGEGKKIYNDRAEGEMLVEYLECRFGEGEGSIGDEVIVGGVAKPKVENFRYLGSIIQGGGTSMKTLTIV